MSWIVPLRAILFASVMMAVAAGSAYAATGVPIGLPGYSAHAFPGSDQGCLQEDWGAAQNNCGYTVSTEIPLWVQVNGSNPGQMDITIRADSGVSCTADVLYPSGEQRGHDEFTWRNNKLVCYPWVYPGGDYLLVNCYIPQGQKVYSIVYRNPY